MNLLKYANSYINCGLSILPTTISTKQPAFSLLPTNGNGKRTWDKYNSTIADAELVHDWFFASDRDKGIAIIGGQVSGNLEILDFDNHLGNAKQVFVEFAELLKVHDEPLFNSLVIEKTQSGGYHVFYRCPTIAGNTKLAEGFKSIENEDGSVAERRETIIETRGQGGYAIVAPTPGYELKMGSFENIPTINSEQRDMILLICRSFNDVEDAIDTSKRIESGYAEETSEERPGDAFNRNGNIEDVLTKGGWTKIGNTEGRALWRRPGKSSGMHSATYGFVKEKLFVFSSNAYPFEMGKSYDKFACYAMIYHKGDFKAAANDLFKLGYGSKSYKINGLSKYHSSSLNSGEAETSNILEFEQSDVGNSLRFFNIYNGKVKYNHTQSKWLIWDGKYWQPDDTNKIVELAKEAIATIKDEIIRALGTEAANKLHKWYIQSENAGKIDAMLRLSQSIEGIAATSDYFDNDPYLFNVKNGVYDLRKNQLLPHHPDFHISKISNIEYSEDATCIFWEDALYTYFGNDEELIRYIQKICGLTMCGDHLEELIFFLYGLGKNGKSVFIKVLEMVFGDYSQKAPVEMLLLNKNESSIPNDVARLKGVRFAITSELPKGKRLNENRVKDLTGGDKITARFLHKEFFEFKPTHKLWIFGNHKPTIHGNDEGIWRRMVLIPFLHEIPENERKSHSELMDIFKSELPGILKWIIDGWKMYRSEGLNPPSEVEKATRAYREEQDILADFINEVCDVSSSINRVRAKDIQNAYQKWCDQNNETPLKNKTFYATLEERGFKRIESGHGREREFAGITIKDGMFANSHYNNN